MLKDSRINASAGCTIAFTAWAAAVIFMVLMWVTGDRRVATTGLFFTGIAVTATVRTYFVDFSTMVRKAFEIERDSVTPLRRP